MNKTKRQLQEQNSDVDMTPMLDIVFILLIFFIVTTSFVKEEGLLINRPNKSQSNSPNKPVIMLQINENGLIQFNGKAVDIERIPARIENFLAKNETSSAVVIPHANVTYDTVVKVIDQVKLFDQLTVAIGK